MMENATSVMSMFEGVCPECGGELEVRQAAGYPCFHANYSFNEGNVVVWEGKPDDLSDIGAVGFDCLSCHRSMEAYADAWGDWVASQ